MQKVFIWKLEDGDVGKPGYLIEASEIEERALYMDDGSHWVIKNLYNYNLTQLKEKLEREALKKEDADHGHIKCLTELNINDFEELLRKIGYEDVSVEQLNNYPEFEPELPVFNHEDGLFYHLNNIDFETARVFEYYDGSNLKQIVNDGNSGIIETKLVISENYITLDEWFGTNKTTGGLGLHQDVYKVIENNDEKVNNQYLIYYLSEWQGEQTTAEIMTENELRNHIKSLGRDVEEYMKDIQYI